jgi:uncharacterized pyridoxamine 5'-phosphate oxidase family protein
MPKPTPKELVYHLLTNNRAAALATVTSQGLPHVATVYCLIDEDFSLHFVTRVEARKYRNMISQPLVAMSFMDEVNVTSVQLTGRAERIESFAEEQVIFYKLMSLRYEEDDWPLPPLRLFESGLSRELAVFKVTPTELTYANFQLQPGGRYKPFFTKII